jgi:hypothetical protein
MTVGIAAASMNSFVDGLTSGVYLQYHVGDPGAAGTANQAGSSTRVALMFPAASGGASTQTGTASIASWAGGAQTLTHVSWWSASSGGTYRGSCALSSSASVVNGDTINAVGFSVAVTPVAA